MSEGLQAWFSTSIEVIFCVANFDIATFATSHALFVSITAPKMTSSLTLKISGVSTAGLRISILLEHTGDLQIIQRLS